MPTHCLRGSINPTPSSSSTSRLMRQRPPRNLRAMSSGPGPPSLSCHSSIWSLPYRSQLTRGGGTQSRLLRFLCRHSSSLGASHHHHAHHLPYPGTPPLNPHAVSYRTTSTDLKPPIVPLCICMPIESPPSIALARQGWRTPSQASVSGMC